MCGMESQSAAELAELTMNVLSELPYEVLSPLANDAARTETVTFERLEGELFVARWDSGAPDLGTEREFRLGGDHAVYLLTATVAGLGAEDDRRLLRVTGLRRKRQRRANPRAEIRDLVLVSHEDEIDADLVDVSATGLSFVLDRPLAVDLVIRAVLNAEGTVIPTVACVRQVTELDEHEYRIGCAFTEISEPHRSLLGRYAAQRAFDRRRGAPPSTLRSRLFLSE